MNSDCLNDRDLILLHYGETPDRAAAATHLAGCPGCRDRAGQLAAALSRIPAPAEPDPHAATRVAARVNERLVRRHRWLPMAGITAAAALGLAVVLWIPLDQPLTPGSQPPVASIETPSVGQPPPAPELDLLEQLELLEELETLRAIEGV